MTGTVSTLMDENLERMLHNINWSISQSLKVVSTQVGKAEQRILTEENALSNAEKSLLVLEETVMELTKCLKDCKNRGWHKNLRIFGLQEKLESTNCQIYGVIPCIL